MYKLLIVDDDEIILDVLEHDIDWEEMGLRVVGAATNGLEGLELVKERKPHIILSDIHMPHLNGLELAEKVLDLFPHMKFVFLTAHEDFSYAKKAIHLKATEYVLKYAEKEEIIKAVIKAKNELDGEIKTRIDIEKSFGILRSELLSDMLASVVNEELIREQMRRLEIGLSGNQFVVAVASIKDYSRFSPETNSSELELAIRSTINISNEILFTYGKGIAFTRSNEHVHILFAFDEQLDAMGIVYEILEDIVDKVSTFLKIDLAIGVGDISQGLSKIKNSYHEALHALEWGGERGSGIIPFDSVKLSDDSQLSIFRRIIKYVDDHYNQSITLNDIAKEVNISHTYVCTLFRKHKNRTFSDYLIQVRIHKAKELLKNTKLKTYEVSESVGYPNPQYFSILFKKCTGCTPTEFKKQYL